MPRYHQLGNIPHKRHTAFRKKDGSLYYEQLFGTIGFDGMSSLLYHTHPPTAVKEILSSTDISPKIAVENNMQMRALKGFNIKGEKDFLMSRIPVLINSDVTIHLASPNNINHGYYYKNADVMKLFLFIRGKSSKTQLGNQVFFRRLFGNSKRNNLYYQLYK